ncbi:hypothetical protein PAXINDRAFT_96914 [Paxillus involutus ATCC 200175]|nr:hypothetical protein PAXINDRAFT_96914 [Paxillus involutus ATCC 200175]
MDLHVTRKTPNGYLLPWSELVCKSNKHCEGFQDVADVAFQLATNATNEDCLQVGSEPDNEFRLGEECILLPEQIEKAASGYEVLKQLESRHSDSLALALAYYAYTMGRLSECLTVCLECRNS